MAAKFSIVVVGNSSRIIFSHNNLESQAKVLLILADQHLGGQMPDARSGCWSRGCSAAPTTSRIRPVPPRVERTAVGHPPPTPGPSRREFTFGYRQHQVVARNSWPLSQQSPLVGIDLRRVRLRDRRAVPWTGRTDGDPPMQHFQPLCRILPRKSRIRVTGVSLTSRITQARIVGAATCNLGASESENHR
jgi:hypothetical protein